MNMAENITFVERYKIFPELFYKVTKESFDLTSSLFHSGETILEQTSALST